MASIEFGNSRHSTRGDFPTHWGEAPPAREEQRRVSWILENIRADEATGVPAAVRARRILHERAETLAPSVRDALVRIVRFGGLG